MSGARTIETWDDVPHEEFNVRLCEGRQVLAIRKFSYRDLYLDSRDRYDLEYAGRCMGRHDELLQQSLGSASAITERELAAANFNAAVATLFPEFGTVPDGVETTT